MSEEKILKNKLNDFVKKSNMVITPDTKIFDNITYMLLKNKDLYGDNYCPCKVDKTKSENICPCDEVREANICHCGLFVKDE